MAAPRFNLISDLELPLRAISEAISTIMTSIHELCKRHEGAVVEESIKTLSRALSSAMAMPHRPTVLAFQHATPYYCKPHAVAGHAEIVQTKLAELKRASSPSEPLCFNYGDRGHFAAQCCNATLCFICNCPGHRSSQCRANTSFELSKSDPLLSEIPTDTLPDSLLHPSPLTSPDAGSESSQQSLPVEAEVTPMVSIKRMEMELAEFKHEIELMEKKRFEMELAMASFNAQIHNSKSEIDKMEVSETPQQRTMRQNEDENINEVLDVTRQNDEVMKETLAHETAIEQVLTLSPKTDSDIEVNGDEEEFKGAEPIKVQLVDIQPTIMGIEDARQKDFMKETLAHESEIEMEVSPQEVSASAAKKVGCDVEAIRQILLTDIAAMRQRFWDVRNKLLRGGSLRPRRSGGRRVKS